MSTREERAAVIEWGNDLGVTWENADPATREQFTLVRLFWFYMMIQHGGPDGSELDAEVVEFAKEAVEWFGPILDGRVEKAL